MKIRVMLISIAVLILVIIGYFYFFLPVPSFETGSKRLYLKEIQEDNMTIAWFFYSAAYSESPDYIVATKGSAIDTICRANNIADINLEGDSIMIGFYGSPQLYGDPIEIPIRVMGYSVLIDTGYTRDSETAPRKFYQK